MQCYLPSTRLDLLPVGLGGQGRHGYLGPCSQGSPGVQGDGGQPSGLPMTLMLHPRSGQHSPVRDNPPGVSVPSRVPVAFLSMPV